MELAELLFLTFRFFSQTDEKVNDKPVYERLGNRNMHLSFTNVSAYPTPWTMWAGDDYPSGSHIGNIKIGPSDIDCPENNMVKGMVLLCDSFHCFVSHRASTITATARWRLRTRS